MCGAHSAGSIFGLFTEAMNASVESGNHEPQFGAGVCGGRLCGLSSRQNNSMREAHSAGFDSAGGGKTKHQRGALVFCFGDPCGNRTHVYAVRGRRLSRLTKGPFFDGLIIIS